MCLLQVLPRFPCSHPEHQHSLPPGSIGVTSLCPPEGQLWQLPLASTRKRRGRFMRFMFDSLSTKNPHTAGLSWQPVSRMGARRQAWGSSPINPIALMTHSLQCGRDGDGEHGEGWSICHWWSLLFWPWGIEPSLAPNPYWKDILPAILLIFAFTETLWKNFYILCNHRTSKYP